MQGLSNHIMQTLPKAYFNWGKNLNTLEKSCDLGLFFLVLIFSLLQTPSLSAILFLGVH